MAAKYFIQKIKIVGYVIVALFVACACGYAGLVKRAEYVDIYTSYYFLVTEDTRVEAGAAFVQLEGGAGYLLEQGKDIFVAVSVYEREEEGLFVQENLKKRGTETKLLQASVNRLRFLGEKKRRVDLYIDALRTYEGYVTVLNKCIQRLEQGETQENCKSTLRVLIKQLSYAKKQYAEYAEYSRVCEEAERNLTELCNSIVYLKDLRYQLCWQVAEYLSLCSAFSL